MEGTKLKKSRMPDPYVILFVLIVIMAALTYIIPSGQYKLVKARGGRMVVNPGSFECVKGNRAGLYISRYAKKVKEDPDSSLIYDTEQKEKGEVLDPCFNYICIGHDYTIDRCI